jgi:hypothetical protein
MQAGFSSRRLLSITDVMSIDPTSNPLDSHISALAHNGKPAALAGSADGSHAAEHPRLTSIAEGLAHWSREPSGEALGLTA